VKGLGHRPLPRWVGEDRRVAGPGVGCVVCWLRLVHRGCERAGDHGPAMAGVIGGWASRRLSRRRWWCGGRLFRMGDRRGLLPVLGS